jgi:hypothetical protein
MTYHQPNQLLDAARAVRYVRTNAAKWDVDPDKIGILGFSAGGHLASTLGTHFDSGKATSTDPIERVSSRPDLMILVYPVITMGEFAHAGSKRNLLDENPSEDLVKQYSNELHITADTPPTFIVHTMTDTTVPVENSLMFVQALRRRKFLSNFICTKRALTDSASPQLIRCCRLGPRDVPTGWRFTDLRNQSQQQKMTRNSSFDRRDFLKTAAIGTAGLSLLASAVDAGEMGELPASVSLRQTLPLNHKWLFSEKSSPAAMKPEFNDRAWKSVTIPHTNKLLR